MLIIVQTIIPGISIWYKEASVAIASITGTNYCPDAYFNYACCQTLVKNNVYTRSSIGRPQVEKHASLFVQA